VTVVLLASSGAATGCGSGTDRPAYSLIPTSARWLDATVTKRSSPLRHRSKERTFRTVVATNPSVVQAVAQAVNTLPLAHAEGPVPSCPVYSPPVVRDFRCFVRPARDGRPPRPSHAR
jgi:hypothetical protein